MRIAPMGPDPVTPRRPADAVLATPVPQIAGPRS
jgi:hypothetical protein